MEHAGDDVGRNALDPDVVLHDLVVVELAREADLVLGRGEFLLERQEVLVRLEVGILLDDNEETARARR